MFVGVAYGAAVVLTGALVLLVRRVTAKKPQGRKRTMSFGSKALANGVFPEPAEAWKTIINTLIYFDKCPTVEAVVAKCKGLLYYDRFRSALSVGPDGCYFVDISDSIDPERDLVRNVDVSSETEMASKVDELCSKEFPTTEKSPLFVMYRIHNIGTGRSAVLVRLHHAIGDGMALIGCMSHVFEDLKGNPFSLDIPKNAGGGTSKVFNLTTIWKFITSAVSIATLPLTPYDTDIVFTTPNKPNLTMKNKKRHTVYFPVLNLEFVKELKNRAKVTVNDVLLSATAGAIRRYSIVKKDPLFTSTNSINSSSSSSSSSSNSVKNIQCRALMPVAFPRSQSELSNPSKAMRNYFAMISVPLPMCENTPQQRLQSCSAVTTQLKSSPLALLQLLVQNKLLALAPDFLVKKTAHDVFSRHSMVFSNLPGPTEQLVFCEQPVTGMQIIFPNLIPQVLIISYNGGVYFNMNLDPELVDACDTLPQLFLDEITDLANSYGMKVTLKDIVQQ